MPRLSGRELLKKCASQPTLSRRTRHEDTGAERRGKRKERRRLQQSPVVASLECPDMRPASRSGADDDFGAAVAIDIRARDTRDRAQATRLASAQWMPET